VSKFVDTFNDMNLAKFVLIAAVFAAAAGCSVARSEAAHVTVEGKTDGQPAGAATPVKAQQQTASVAAQGTAAETVVQDLYRVHAEEFRTSRFRIMSGKDRKLLDKYFDKNLADLIWKDLTTHVGEVGVLDFDPFYNAQDADIKNLKVSPAVVEGDKASSTVTFTNYGKKEKLIYTLVKQNGAWKISDINYGEGNTLLKFFAEGA